MFFWDFPLISLSCQMRDNLEMSILTLENAAMTQGVFQAIRAGQSQLQANHRVM